MGKYKLKYQSWAGIEPQLFAVEKNNKILESLNSKRKAIKKVKKVGKEGYLLQYMGAMTYYKPKKHGAKRSRAKSLSLLDNLT